MHLDTLIATTTMRFLTKSSEQCVKKWTSVTPKTSCKSYSVSSTMTEAAPLVMLNSPSFLTRREWESTPIAHHLQIRMRWRFLRRNNNFLTLTDLNRNTLSWNRKSRSRTVPATSLLSTSLRSQRINIGQRAWLAHSLTSLRRVPVSPTTTCHPWSHTRTC